MVVKEERERVKSGRVAVTHFRNTDCSGLGSLLKYNVKTDVNHEYSASIHCTIWLTIGR